MAKDILIQRPQRWDEPFSADMSEAQVDGVLAIKPFSDMDPARFPRSTPLREIIRNDTRIRRYREGDIIVRAGDYGSSAFLVLDGRLRAVLGSGLPDALLGRVTSKKKGVFEALAQLWTNPRNSEVRDPTRIASKGDTGTHHVGTDEVHIVLQDVPAVLDGHRTAPIEKGEIFGELAALGRIPRTATVFAEGDAECLELRWQGLRDIRSRDDAFRHYVDRLYRERGLTEALRQTPVLAHLDDADIASIANETLFETYGEFDWHATFKRLVQRDAAERLAGEPVIAREGDYPDGLLVVRSGFARVSRQINNGHQTVSYVGRGGVFGLEEIAHNWRHTDQTVSFRRTLRAVGYVDILRVPTSIVESYVLPNLPARLMPPPLDVREGRGVEVRRTPNAPAVDTGFLEFLVENRYINGTATMLIDLERCVRCDACVEACAATHGNNPRFNRHGRRYGKYMVANACMHCADPVCMIGCPTGAIHRNSPGGQVVINDDTCIGCATCANSCPYDNIRMVEIRNPSGGFILDDATNARILKATKCDLCFEQPGGPACQRACPHDALRRVDLRDENTLDDWLDR